MPDTPTPEDRPIDVEFDWNREAPAVVLQRQPKTAVYLNPEGQIVIRQMANYPFEDQDPYILVNPESAPALIAAINDALKSRG